ncbi:Ankyrin repeat family protein [Euphorbia peplus]|nr:Ankyrin repeat family protein [Euphorbia peplus]
MLRLTTKQKDTALHLAVRGRYLDVVQEILKHEDPNFTYTANISGETPLYIATEKERLVIANEILDKFESPDCGGPNGRTAFHAAAAAWRYDPSAGWGSLDIFFSKVGSFVNQADESGWTPLHYAAYLNDSEMVSQILGKDIHSAYATDKERNRTALHTASCRGNVGVMEKIIEKCPECCEIRDARGWNVLHYEMISKSEEAIRVTLQDSPLVYLISEKDAKGYTPFHLFLVSHPFSSLSLWIRNESAVPGELWADELCSIRRNQDFVLNKDEDKELLEWTKDLGRDPFGRKLEVEKDLKQVQKEREEKIIPELEKAKDSHLVVAALVATVTFAAAFTLPGGYISDENNTNLKGTPILSRNAAFNVFVITDAIAMVLSTSSVFIHFIMVMLGYKRRYYWLIRSAFWFLVLAMGAMVIAFVTGTYAVLAPPSKGLAIATSFIGLTFFLHAAYATSRLIVDFIKHDKVENDDSSTSESVLRLLDTVQYISCFDWLFWKWNSIKNDSC